MMLAGVMVVSALLTYAIGFPIYRMLERRNVIDTPNTRSSHVVPTVRGGGLAIVGVLVAVAAVACWRSWNGELVLLMAAVIAVFALSLADDLKGLPAHIRILGHAVAALMALFALSWPRVSLALSDQQSIPLGVALSFVVTFVWLVGYTNAFNFMDGINGLASAQAAITGAGAGILAWLTRQQPPELPMLMTVAVAAAASGFFPHNFPRARMFMGDVGSAPLGFLLAVLILWLARDSGWWLLLPLSLLHANFVLDTGITLVRRIWRGERWHEAHREHFYQRLVRSGKSHAFVTLWEVSLQAIVLLLMAIYVRSDSVTRLALIAVVLMIWLGFFAYCEARFRLWGQTKPILNTNLAL